MTMGTKGRFKPKRWLATEVRVTARHGEIHFTLPCGEDRWMLPEDAMRLAQEIVDRVFQSALATTEMKYGGVRK